MLTNQKPEHSRYPEVVNHNKKLPGNLLWQSGCWSRGGNIVRNITTIAFNSGFRLHTLPCLWLYRANMDEYDEMFGIEDDFDDQFADELDAMAQMEKGED